MQVAFPYVYLRDAESAAHCIERAYAVPDRPPFWVPLAELYAAWARGMQGQPEAALPDLRSAIDAFLKVGHGNSLSFYLGLLAELQLTAGHPADGLATLEQALAANTEQRMHLPELLRLRGELRAASGADPTDVEADLLEAIARARELGARLHELRATTSLARWLAARGGGAEGRALLAPLYAAFTEGHGARDLVEARALLEELGG